MGWLAFTVLAPLGAAALLLAVPGRSAAVVRVVALLGALASLVGSAVVAWGYHLGRGGVQFREEVPLLPDLGIAWRLGVDGWGIALLLLTAVIVLGGVLATWTEHHRTKEFYVLLLVLAAGVFGVFVSLDLFLFFLFYEIAVLPMYLLIGIWGSSKSVPPAGPFRAAYAWLDVGGRRYAAMKLTLMLLLGSALILAGFLAMVEAAGSWNLEVLEAHAFPRSLQLWAFPALWLGFGTLAGVWPWHTWSPDGHASAPTAVSMLHAGVLMKLGAFGVLRIGMVCLPEGAAAWAVAVGVVAAINIVYGAASALGQTDLKYVVAYSSVSHMGVVMLGAATLAPEGWNGAVFQMVAHGVMTGLFFCLVGIVYGRAHHREVFRMGGFAAAMPWVAVFFTVAGLSSLGMPGFAGFPAELLVFLGAWGSAHSWWVLPGIAGAVITSWYVMRVVRAIFWGPPGATPLEGLFDLRGVEWGAPVLLAACILLLGLAPDLLLQYIDPTTTGMLERLGRGAELAALGGLAR